MFPDNISTTMKRRHMILHASSVLLLLAAPARPQAITADSVRNEFLHAWNGYVRYAWGSDALRSVSQTPRNWYRVSLCMTPVEAFDGLLLMGLHSEARQAKALIMDSLSFDQDIEVQSFEITIRLLGGLLSAYQMDGDSRFLSLAHDLGTRLLPVFGSRTGMPYRFVNLRTGQVRDSLNNPAEIGTALLEFGALSRLTGQPAFYTAARKALDTLYSRRSRIGLVGTTINVETGEWVDRTSHIGGMIDSYYEYLVKAWLLFRDEECRTMALSALDAVSQYVADTRDGHLWYGQVDMDTGERIGTSFGALEAFFPAVLCLMGDTTNARALQESCYRMWTLHGIEPETIDYATMTITRPQYYLRPEIIESAYYLYRVTRDPRYRSMGETFYRSLVRYCRTESGYAALQSVVTGEKRDEMESFFLAETLKYLYLLFAPDSTLPFGSVVFTTEAHPLINTWNR